MERLEAKEPALVPTLEAREAREETPLAPVAVAWLKTEVTSTPALEAMEARSGGRLTTLAAALPAALAAASRGLGLSCVRARRGRESRTRVERVSCMVVVIVFVECVGFGLVVVMTREWVICEGEVSLKTWEMDTCEI